MKINAKTFINESDNYLKTNKRNCNMGQFYQKLRLHYGPDFQAEYITEKDAVGKNIILDGFYFPVSSKRNGCTVFYMRCGQVEEVTAKKYLWWADNLGAYSGKLLFI